ncbi:MAG TPA: argininosuccinate lyase [Thermomicrobiales bacterium]|nr:argininosuccinate lyase [Thermomicrobiales bacterium]
MSNDTAGTFPHPAYAQNVLEPAFEESKEHLFAHMIAANEAHAIMLAECGVLDPAQASALLTALGAVKQQGAEAFRYSPEIEDLFFAVEGRLIELVGPDAGGNLQIARSRNDLAAAMSRMMLRERLVGARQQVLHLRSVLLDMIEQHIETLMPGITHTQPAQPTTLAHYLLGVLGPLERDSDRLSCAWRRTNRSSLGVAAFTTTSFSIGRELTADLLGFDGYVENGYDAVGANDHLLESVQALVNCVGSLSRFVYDLLVWARKDVDIIRIDDAFIQMSSIMPQKRNPVVLEHVRVRIGWVYGEASAVETIIHSAAFGDTNDVEDPMFVPLNRAFDAAEMVLRLLAAVLSTAAFNVSGMEQRAAEGNTTTTALADALVQEHGIPFRGAHTIVSRIVSRTMSDDVPITAELVNEVSSEVLGRSLDVTQEFVANALDPWAFVNARTIPGGSAPETTRQALESARLHLDEDRGVLEADNAAVNHASAERQRRIDALMAGASS